MRLEDSRHRGKINHSSQGENWLRVSGLGEVRFHSDGSFCLISEKPNIYS